MGHFACPVVMPAEFKTDTPGRLLFPWKYGLKTTSSPESQALWEVLKGYDRRGIIDGYTVVAIFRPKEFLNATQVLEYLHEGHCSAIYCNGRLLCYWSERYKNLTGEQWYAKLDEIIAKHKDRWVILCEMHD